jgi:hypothetical protein
MARFFHMLIYKTTHMKRYILLMAVISLVAACSEGTEITARPDASTSTSGTLGSVKATDGIVPLKPSPFPVDTTRQK